MTIKKCIIIPAYNEARNIAAVIENIRKYSNADIIVINDGSADGTAEAASQAGSLVISHPFNMGYGVALQTGYKYAREMNYDVLLQMDGDGQHSAAFIPELFASVENGSCDVAIGSRFLGDHPYRIGFLKSAGIFIFRKVIRLTTGRKITDPTSGYQCLNRKTVAFFTRDDLPCDYPDANVIVMLHRSGFRIREVPVDMMPNPQNRSMHHGMLKITYYIFKVFLSIFVTLIRKGK